MEEKIEWGLKYDCDLTGHTSCALDGEVAGPLTEYTARRLKNLLHEEHLVRLVNRKVVTYPWGELE